MIAANTPLATPLALALPLVVAPLVPVVVLVGGVVVAVVAVLPVLVLLPGRELSRGLVGQLTPLCAMAPEASSQSASPLPL